MRTPRHGFSHAVVVEQPTAGLRLLLLATVATPALAFIEQLFGGGGIQFEQPRVREAQWPRGVPDSISKQMSWLRGTEWNWNNDGFTLKFDKEGEIDAPINQCQRSTCKWSAENG